MSQVSAYSDPSFLIPVGSDDYMRSTVRSQSKFEARVSLIILVMGVMFWALWWWRDGFGWFSLLGDGFLALMGMGLIMIITETIIFRPMHKFRYGACQQATYEQIAHSFNPQMARSWQEPLPYFLAVAPAERAIFIQTPQTNYDCVAIRPYQIVDMKIERKQTLKTTTKTRHGMSFSFWPSNSFAIHSGSNSTSRSETEVVEQSFLEISFAMSVDSVPIGVSFNFGKNRREAEDWMAAITHMARHT